MDAKTRSKIPYSTQDHLEIREVIDDIVISKTGSLSIVIQTTSLNFDLLSEYEQDSKIYAFAGLLNSLNFHIQVLIRTHRIDIESYVDNLKAQLQREIPPGLRLQLQIYIQFIQNLIVQNDVLDKKFYIIIPFNPTVTIGTDSKSLSSINKDKLIEQGKIFLYPKRDHILKQLGKMGLMGHQVTSNELIELLYNIYNPTEDPDSAGLGE